MHFSLHPVATRGGLQAAGSGWTDPSTWLIAVGALLVLAALAWWAARPARRARRKR